MSNKYIYQCKANVFHVLLSQHVRECRILPKIIVFLKIMINYQWNCIWFIKYFWTILNPKIMLFNSRSKSSTFIRNLRNGFYLNFPRPKTKESQWNLLKPQIYDYHSLSPDLQPSQFPKLHKYLPSTPYFKAAKTLNI